MHAYLADCFCLWPLKKDIASLSLITMNFHQCILFNEIKQHCILLFEENLTLHVESVNIFNEEKCHLQVYL